MTASTIGATSDVVTVTWATTRRYTIGDRARSTTSPTSTSAGSSPRSMAR